MTIQKVCQNFSEYNENLQLLSTQIFPDLIEIYLKSIVPEDLLYDQFIIMSARTSNNYNIIKDMPFNKFNKLSKALNRYIEAENKRENGENPDVQKQSEEMMSNQRNMMNQMKSSFKAPKMSKLK
nr:MAG TPA: hypothetical protein [Caudoviricetes sp.]